MRKPFAYLEIRGYHPKRETFAQGQRVVTRFSLKLRRRTAESYETIAVLASVHVVARGKTSTEMVRADRARVWEQLAQWIQHLLIFPDPVVQQRQYENRVKLERWNHGLDERPREQDLYDWKEDKETILRLRANYISVYEKLCAAIGPPQREDFNHLYPNRYDDGLSDKARQAWYTINVLFGDPSTKEPVDAL